MKISSLSELEKHVGDRTISYANDETGFTAVWDGRHPRLHNGMILWHGSGPGDHMELGVAHEASCGWEMARLSPDNNPHRTSEPGGARRSYVHAPHPKSLGLWCLQELERPLAFTPSELLEGGRRPGAQAHHEDEKGEPFWWHSQNLYYRNAFDTAHLELTHQYSLGIMGYDLGLMLFDLVYDWVHRVWRLDYSALHSDRACGWAMVAAARAIYLGLTSKSDDLVYVYERTSSRPGSSSSGSGAHPPLKDHPYIRWRQSFQLAFISWGAAYSRDLAAMFNADTFPDTIQKETWDTLLDRAWDLEEGISYCWTWNAWDSQNEVPVSEMQEKAPRWDWESHQIANGQWILRRVPDWKNSVYLYLAPALSHFGENHEITKKILEKTEVNPNWHQYTEYTAPYYHAVSQ